MQKYGELLRTILEKRGIIDEAQAEIFLNPDYERDFHDPFLMRDMERACVRLYKAVEDNEKIIIYADYDCDGIPGAVILNDLFKKINYTNYEIYIPQRNSEGYGLNLEAIEQFIKNSVKLLITIDLGITAVEEVARAKEMGIDVIITDHHLPHRNLGEGGLASIILPQAFAILNPKVDGYPGKMPARRSLGEGGLCGAGVVFKFAQGFLKYIKNQKFALRHSHSVLEGQVLSGRSEDSSEQTSDSFRKLKDGAEKWMLDMAGIATLSDLVPLTGENRAIAYFGMKVLRKSPRPGLQKLLAKLNIDQKYLSEDDIGFMIAPRLNAASRMDDPMVAYELLSTDDEAKAGTMADHLSKINDDRKTMVTSIMREVNKKFEKDISRSEKEILVVGNPLWRVGVLGLVAGKISESHKKPVFVWGKDENDVIKGSCRSDGSVSLVELMTETKESFLEFGGHEFAGGFTVHSEKIHFLEESLCLSYKKVKREKIENEIVYDVRSDLSAVNMKNWKELEKLAPFGLANPKPVFLFENVCIENIKKFGKNGSGEHLKITFSDHTDSRVKAVSFFSNTDSFKTPLSVDKKVNLLATFDLSRFRGNEELRLRVEDIY